MNKSNYAKLLFNCLKIKDDIERKVELCVVRMVYVSKENYDIQVIDTTTNLKNVIRDIINGKL